MHKIQVISADFLISYHFVKKISADMHEMSPAGEAKPVFRKSYMNSNQTE